MANIFRVQVLKSRMNWMRVCVGAEEACFCILIRGCLCRATSWHQSVTVPFGMQIQLRAPIGSEGICGLDYCKSHARVMTESFTWHRESNIVGNSLLREDFASGYRLARLSEEEFWCFSMEWIELENVPFGVQMHVRTHSIVKLAMNGLVYSESHVRVMIECFTWPLLGKTFHLCTGWSDWVERSFDVSHRSELSWNIVGAESRIAKSDTKHLRLHIFTVGSFFN